MYYLCRLYIGKLVRIYVTKEGGKVSNTGYKEKNKSITQFMLYFDN